MNTVTDVFTEEFVIYIWQNLIIIMIDLFWITSYLKLYYFQTYK